MAARSKIGATWTASDGSNAGTLALPARTITAGSLVIVAMRYEGPVSGTVTGVSDGTRNYTVLTEYGANPTVCIAYYWGHPGETNSVITFSVSGTSTIYKEAYAVEYDGSDASDPFDTSATSNGTNPSVNYSAAGDGLAIALIGYYSGSSITPTSPATAEGSQTYSSLISRTHAAGSNTIAGTGGAGNTNTLVAVFLEPGGGGGPSIRRLPDQMSGGMRELSGGIQ